MSVIGPSILNLGESFWILVLFSLTHKYPSPIGEYACVRFGKGRRRRRKKDDTGDPSPETIQTALENRKEALMAKKKEKKAEKGKEKKKNPDKKKKKTKGKKTKKKK